MEFFSFFFCFGEGKNNIRMWGVTQSVVDTEKFKYCAMQVERRAPPASFVANVKNFASFPSQSIKFSRKFPPRRFCSKKNFFHLFKRHKYKSRGEGRFMAVSCCFHRESWKLNRWLGVGKLPRKMKTFHCAWTLVSCKSLDSVWVALILTTVGCLFGSYHNRSKKKKGKKKTKINSQPHESAISNNLGDPRKERKKTKLEKNNENRDWPHSEQTKRIESNDRRWISSEGSSPLLPIRFSMLFDSFVKLVKIVSDVDVHGRFITTENIFFLRAHSIAAEFFFIHRFLSFFSFSRIANIPMVIRRRERKTSCREEKN